MDFLKLMTFKMTSKRVNNYDMILMITAYSSEKNLNNEISLEILFKPLQKEKNIEFKTLT